MIPVVAAEDAAQTRRMLDALQRAGISTRLTEELSETFGAPDGYALVPVSKMVALGQSPVPKPRLAVGSQSPVAHSQPMRRVLDLVERVAATDISVLVSGESGTGKEVICREIHARSARADGPFIAINCAAIPESMVEAELFGHEKGAFTGASETRKGKFELAHGGTLLLDEITEMPLEPQAKLLRVLQEREVERIGSNRTTEVDVRVLATSNRDLKKAVAEGVLREDLYYRLSVFPMALPPLRERKDDVLPIAQSMLRRYARGRDVGFSDAAVELLNGYSWPGNVRELENCMQRALVMCQQDTIDVADLGLAPSEAHGSETLREQLQSQQDQVLLQKLSSNNGSRKDTAAQLGISERTLRHKLKQMRDRGAL